MMIYLVTKLPLKPISCAQFHELISSFHKVCDVKENNITFFDHGYMIQEKQVFAYHIEEEWSYEYIFNEKTYELHISLNQKNQSIYKDFIGYLIKNNYLEKDDEIEIKDTPHYFTNVLSKHQKLPVLYFNQSLSEPYILNECAKRLKGLVHVVYGNEVFNESMTIQNHSKSYISLFNDEKMFFSKRKDEDDDSFIDRVFYKIQSYMNKRVFDEPYKMNVLYQKALNQLILHSKNNEKNILNNYDLELSRIENRKENYINRIEQLTSQMTQLEYQIEYLENIVNEQNEYPLLFKGNEKELYEGEQKDMILYLIQEELKTEKDPERIALYESILEENPKQGTRDMLFEEITRILMSCKDVNEKARNDLRKVGVCLEKKQKHIDGCFFNDQRYLITMSSTTSDINSNRQTIRMIRKVFF